MRSALPILVAAALATTVTLGSTPALAQKAEPKKPNVEDSKSDENAGAWSENKGENKDQKDPSKVEPPKEKWDIYDVDEVPGRNYFFVGLRYRGNVIPAFMMGLFLDEAKTVYTNMIGAEFDLRKDGFSLIPALTYHEVGTEDLLLKQKSTPDIPGNYSVVNSGMKIVYASVDLLWSTKLAKNVEFEYGAGFGLGAVFGDLENSWVRVDPNGSLQSETGKRYTRCEVVAPSPGTGCHPADHQNSEVNKVNGYKEESWFSGGSKPAVWPWISVPQIGLRFKPVKNFVARLGLGFSLTGFWFGLNGQYGLERPRD